jgi:signal transduction histidine kinase
VTRILTYICLQVVGLLLWRRRPENPVGPLLLGVSVTAAASYLTYVPHSALLVVGFMAQPLGPVMVGHVLLVYPDGRYHHHAERLFIRTAYAVSVALQVPILLVSRTGWINGCSASECVANPLLIRVNSPLAYATDNAAAVGQIALALVFVGLLTRRILRAGPAVRRAYRPTIAVFAVLLATHLLRQRGTWMPGPRTEIYTVAVYAQLVASMALPVSMAYGLLRARPDVADLITRLEQTSVDRVEEELRAVLADPTLRVALRRAGGDVVDLAGQPIDTEEPDRARTAVDADTSLVHDPVLLDDPALLGSVAAAVRLTLDKARLEAEVRAQLREAKESRARLASAALDERRRIERDLHDGAQQRLIAVGMSIQHARRYMEEASAPARALDEAASEVVNTLSELRELARGLRPALLVERGLAGAIPELARRSPLPVRCELDVNARLPDDIETTAYFVVSEALQNVAKHARANRAWVAIVQRSDQLRVVVGDDGIGGANTRGGSGLRGLADRLAVSAGALTITSPPGAGTVISAEIPVPAGESHLA